MSPGNAHADSLPIFAFMQRLEAMPVGEASKRMQQVVDVLQLRNDLRVVIVVSDEKTVVDMESTTNYGSEILRELTARSEFLPCPDGGCEYERGACKWCGKVQQQ